MLGNLKVEEIERRSGVVFPEELKLLMNETHQDEASNIKPGRWHCFDLPFTLLCGDMEIAERIYSYLKPLSSNFKQQLQIAIQP